MKWLETCMECCHTWSTGNFWEKCPNCESGRAIGGFSPEYIKGRLEGIASGGKGRHSTYPVGTHIEVAQTNTPNYVPVKARGRKRGALPEERILQLSKEGLSSRQIAKQINNEGAHVSYKTVQRLLVGQKILV